MGIEWNTSSISTAAEIGLIIKFKQLEQSKNHKFFAKIEIFYII